MSTPRQRIQLGLLLANLNPRGLILALLLLLFVPFALLAVFYSTAQTVRGYWQASNSTIISEIEANGAGDRWRELASDDLGQWFGERPVLAARIVRECGSLPKVEEKGWLEESPEERVCHSAAHPIPAPVLIKEPYKW